MLATSSAEVLIQLVERALGSLCLVTASDRRYFRELTRCREELRVLARPGGARPAGAKANQPRDGGDKQQRIAKARMIGARLGREQS